MDFFEKMVDTVSIKGKEVISAAKDTKDIMKLKTQIKNDEHEIAKQMYFIGVKYYEEHKEIFDEGYAGYFERIEELKADISLKEQQISMVGKE